MDETADNRDTAEEALGAPGAGRDAAPTDAALVARAREGDDSAFEELFNRHRRRVALVAGRFFRQRERIEEIVQESFTKAFFALPEFSNQREASFAAWVARIAFNACYDELRRDKRRPESALSEISDEEAAWLSEQLADDSAGSDIEASATAKDLAGKLLARLSPEDRLLLVMLDIEGMSVSEIAESTKWSASKVKVRAHRARASLRRVLARFL